MKEIYFKKLTLNHWRAQDKTICFSEHTRICGRNETGKSTVWDAILWLFTGYDSLNRSNYRLFDEHIVPTKDNSRPASVELVLMIDGLEYTLKKTAEMGWARKRGSAEYEKKTSDDYRFEIDGVDVPVSTYKEFIETNFCPIDKLRFILNVNHFLMLEWRELRKNFADIIGEVKREDYNGDFTEAFALIDKYGSIDAAREYLKSQRKPMREAIGDNNSDVKGTKVVQMETLESALPDISGVDEACARIEEIKDEISGIDREMAGATESIKPAIERRNAQLEEIAGLESELKGIERRIMAEYNDKQNAVLEEIRTVDSYNAGVENENRNGLRRMKDAESRIATLENRLDTLSKYRESLLAQKNEVKGLMFKEEKCPYCGQPLPADKMEEALEKFNRQKEAKYSSIVAEGKANNEKMDMYRRELDELRAVMGKGYEKKELKSKADLEAKLADLRNSRPVFEEYTEYKEKVTEIAQKRANIEDIPAVDMSVFEIRKKVLYSEMQECASVASNKEKYDRMMERINAIRADIAATAVSLAAVEGLIAKVDEIERQKSEIVKRRMSELFRSCDIRMEERKKDGTMTPSCSILMNGVLVQVANTASKIHAGIDISSAFCRYYGISMPLVIDNREMVDSDKELDDGGIGRQIIELKREDCEFTVVNL